MLATAATQVCAHFPCLPGRRLQVHWETWAFKSDLMPRKTGLHGSLRQSWEALTKPQAQGFPDDSCTPVLPCPSLSTL